MNTQRELLFHDTVPLPEDQLTKSRDRAQKQKEWILDYFRARFSFGFTPVEIHERCEEFFSERILLNSVRRCITDLTTEGRLEKCPKEESKMGRYGINNRTWKYCLKYNPVKS